LLTRDQFIARKQAYNDAKKNKTSSQVKTLAHANCKVDHNPFLKALARREEGLRNGKMTTILFLRIEQPGKEISGYIDLAHRMKTEDFRSIFEDKKKLLPRQTDLSFYHWESQVCGMTDSPNFRVDAGSDQGLLFRNKRDRKVINVNPEMETPGDGSSREVLQCEDYTQVVFFDHFTRRKH